MNVTGNLKDLFGRLEALGNDPYPYSTTLAPSLVFSDVDFSGAQTAIIEFVGAAPMASRCLKGNPPSGFPHGFGILQANACQLQAGAFP